MRGIYAIIRDGGPAYVGQAINIRRRWSVHRSELLAGCHRNLYLRRAWKKHGAEQFAFVVVEECSAEDLDAREQFWLDCFREAGAVYNVGSYADAPMRGRRHGEATRARISAARKGAKFTKEHRAKLSASAKMRVGRRVSEETRAKISASHMGLRATTEQRAKQSAAKRGRPSSLKGRTLSAEHCAKLSAAHIGRPRGW